MQNSVENKWRIESVTLKFGRVFDQGDGCCGLQSSAVVAEGQCVGWPPHHRPMARGASGLAQAVAFLGLSQIPVGFVCALKTYVQVTRICYY